MVLGHSAQCSQNVRNYPSDMGPPPWAGRDTSAASVYQSENSEGPLGGPPVFIINV